MSSGRNNNGWSNRAGRGGTRAFTLLELLVVIAIIGVLAAVALPKIGAFGKSNATIAATRQLLDDVSFARSRAMSSRSDVYMVFAPPSASQMPNNFVANLPTDVERRMATNVMTGQYTTYALFSYRNVGDQPGVKNPRYLTPWKTLPAGTFIATSKYILPGVDGIRTFDYAPFPFPLSSSKLRPLPYFGFDYQGRLIGGHDEVLPLARGSIFYERDANGAPIAPFTADVLENPPNNSRMTNSTWNHVVIDWLTGRPRAERQEVK